MLNKQIRKEVDRIESILSSLTQNNLEKNSDQENTIFNDLSSLSSYYSEIKAKQLEVFSKLLKLIFNTLIKPEEIIIEEYIEFEEISNPKLTELLINFYNIAGVQLFNKKMNDKAEISFSEGLKLANMHGNHLFVIRISSNLAYVYYHQKQYLKCAKMFEIAATLEEVEQEKIDFLNSAFLVYKEIKNYERAANVLKSLIKLLRSSSDPSTIPKIEEYIDIQLILAKGKYKESKELTYDSISEITNLIPILGKENYTHVYYEIGKLCHSMENIVDSIDYFFESYQLTNMENNPIIHAKSALNLALGYIQVDEFNRAEELLNEASSYSSKMKDQKTLEKVEKIRKSLNEIKIGKESLDEKELKNFNIDTKREISSESIIKEDSILEKRKMTKKEEISNISKDIKPREKITENIGFESYYKTLSSIDEKNDGAEILPMEDIETISSVEVLNETNTDYHQEEMETNTLSSYVETEDYLPNSALQSLSFSEDSQDIISPVLSFESAKNMVTSFLRNNGYNVSFNRHVEGFTGTVDLVAVKGNVRRKKIFMLFSSTASDAGLSSYLLQSIIDKGLKIIFLLEGESPRKMGQVNIINSINNLESLKI